MDPQKLQASARSGTHPSTANDLDQQSAINQQPRNGGVWMKKPQASAGSYVQEKDNSSAISSTPSEYGSDDTSHRSPHVSQSSERPVADRDAFIQPDQVQQHWQTRMTPAERAKELAAEMNQNVDRRRSSSSSFGDKILKLGGKKEYKLN
ncbi:hypothetical protein [Parasitella parasitica]|uniref:Uncharacterized protein n=1 Tax=Parasitella parasitica TaxID=35722 RepID=A0A0B7MZ52_9FUNG|nr:hypothetical protein [Parasitella parasitica]